MTLLRWLAILIGVYCFCVVAVVGGVWLIERWM